MEVIENTSKIKEYLEVIKTLERSYQQPYGDNEVQELLNKCYSLAFKKLEE